MATTRESIEDGFRSMRDLVKIGTRRALILGFFVALFAVAVVVTTRETVSDCGDVTDDQRARLESLIEPEPGRSFVATGPAQCVEGEFAAPIVGLAETMDEATDQLLTDGWALETTYMAHFQQLWRHCFRPDLPGWERVQIFIDATRDGTVSTMTAIAPERVDACDLERRYE